MRILSGGMVATAGTFALGVPFSFAQSGKKKHLTREPVSASSKPNGKVLIVYESQFGSTAAIAHFIGENLSSKKDLVDIKKIEEVDELSPYKEIIVGSAIQYDKWMPEARAFIKENEEVLSTKNVSFFLVCLVLSRNTEEARQKANGYAKAILDVVPKVKVQSFGTFAGVLDYSKMSLVQRLFAKAIFVMLGVKEGDYRDWTLIQKWTEKL